MKWRLIYALPLLLLVACGGAEPEQAPTSAPQVDAVTQQLQVLDELQQVIARDYLYAALVDWDTETALVRHQIEAGLTEEQFGAALGGLISVLPEGSASYMTRAERVAAELESGVLYEGIGAFVAVRTGTAPRILLLSVIEGSPAEQAGLRAHDAVYAVDGAPITAEEGLEVVERIRGPAGTEVVLQVASPSEAPREVVVQRGQVTASDTLKGGVLSNGMIHLLVPVASDAGLAESIAGLLLTADGQEQPLLGMMIDLRIAGSSADWPLTEMLSLLGNGSMGHFISREGDLQVDIPGTEIANSQTIPLAILIGPDTNGAPEVFAAAMQSTGRASLIGLPSSGSVLSFRRHTLADGSMVIFAESSYVAADGRDVSLGGLIPDIQVEADWDEVSLESDPVLMQAIELLSQSG
jgi:carboxyl-terminal processing protease